MSEEPREPSDEEMRAALEEQMRRITVKDVLLQTVVTLINLSARKLGMAEGDEKDLVQAKLGIEGARALLPLLPDQDLAPVRDALSQIQMAYAQEAGAGAGSQDAGRGSQVAGDEGPAAPTAPKSSPSDEAERAKARAKIWTPPGT
jgi:hypothetical protein